MEINQPVIEKMSMNDLLKQWQNEVSALQNMESSNPDWEWKSVQNHLENLHSLAHELRQKKAQERAKWQP